MYQLLKFLKYLKKCKAGCLTCIFDMQQSFVRYKTLKIYHIFDIRKFSKNAYIFKFFKILQILYFSKFFKNHTCMHFILPTF